MVNIQILDEFLRKLGYDTTPEKSQFQINEEMSSMLLTLMMSELDFLRQRVETLEAKLK